jgi:hypothetical protein
MSSTTSTAVTVVVAALAGAASAALVLTLGTPAPPAPADSLSASAPSVAGSSDEVAALRDELAALEIESHELRQRLAELEDRADLSSRSTVPPATDALTSQVASQLSSDGSAPAALKTEVALALEQLRADERAEAARAREQRELQRIEERLTDLRTRLNLSPAQENDLRALLLAERAAEAEYDRQRDSGASRDSLREVREQQRKDHVAKLTTILSPEQYESYRQRDNRRGGDAGATGNNNRGRGARGG